MVQNDLLRRAIAFKAARVDCILLLGNMRLETISRIARNSDGPLNIMGSAALPPVTALGAAAVKHVTVSAILARLVSPKSSCPTPC